MLFAIVLTFSACKGAGEGGAHDLGLIPLPDAGGEVRQCEQCLQSSCTQPIEACQMDANCVSTINCAIESHCVTPDLGAVDSCLRSCAQSEGLTVHELDAVVQELTAIAVCGTSCTTTCRVDGGA